MADRLEGELGLTINITGAEQIKKKEAEIESLNQVLAQANDEIDRLREKLRTSEDSEYIRRLEDELDTLKDKVFDISQKLISDFSAFLRTNNLDSSEFGEYSHLFDQMTEGLISYKDAVAEVQRSGVISNIGVDAFTVLDEKLDSIVPKIEDLFNKMQNVGNGTANGTSVFNGMIGEDIDDDRIKRVADSLTALASASPDTPRAMEGMFRALVSATSVASDNKLLDSLKSIATVGGKDYSGLAQLGNFLSSYSKIKDVKVSKASMVNLSEYLPKISNDVDYTNLLKLNKLDLSQFSNLSVPKGNLKSIQEFLQIVSEIPGLNNLINGGSKGGGTGGGSGGNSEYSLISADMTQTFNIQKQLEKALAEGNIVWEKASERYRATRADFDALVDAGNELTNTYSNLESRIEKSSLTDDQKLLLENRRLVSLQNLGIATEKYARAVDDKTQSEMASAANKALGEQEKQRQRNINDLIDLQIELDKISTRSTGVTHSETFGDWTANDTKYAERVNRVQELRSEFEKLGIVITGSEGSYEVGADSFNKMNLEAEEYDALLERVEDGLYKVNKAHTANQDSAEYTWEKARKKLSEYLSREKEIIKKEPDVRKKVAELEKILAEGGDASGLEKFNQKVRELDDLIVTTGANTVTFADRLKKTFGGSIRFAIAGFVTGAISSYLRQIPNDIRKIDTALTDLKIVTRESQTVLDKYADRMTAAAKKIGASIADLINITTTYAKLGYSLDESEKLAIVTAQFSKVSGVSADETARNVTGIIKGYNIRANDIEQIADKLVYIGNNYAITQAEIGEGMNNAASSLYANGNSINEALGLLTAANTTVQDISRASTALRTITARLGASKAELEELGESTEGVETVAKLEKEFKAFGVTITDGNHNLYSTYDILRQIAANWGKYNTEQKNAIANLAAGTRQQDIFFSIINNFTDAQNIVKEADTAIGSLAEATVKRLDSIEGKISQLKATLEGMSRTILSSNLVKMVVTVLNGLVTVSDKILGFADGAIIKLGLIFTTLYGLYKIAPKLLTLLKAGKTLFTTLGNAEGYNGIKGLLLGLPKLILIIKDIGIQSLFATIQTLGLKNAFKALKMTAAETMGVISSFVVVITLIISLLDKFDNAWKDDFENLKEEAQEAREAVKATEAEVEALEDLQQRLIDARGDKAALANIYDELNSKVKTSTELIAGEGEAYRVARAELSALIATRKEEAKRQAEKALEKTKEAFDANKAEAGLAYGYIDWAKPDISAVVMRSLVRANGSEYGFMTSNAYTISKEGYKDFWNEQVKIALGGFSDYIALHGDDILGENALKDVIEYYVREGFGFEEGVYSLTDAVDRYVGIENTLSKLVNKYYEAYANGNDEAFKEAKEQIDMLKNSMSNLYPFLNDYIDIFISNLKVGVSSIESSVDELTKEELEAQLKAYKELVDIRKKLLESYKKELEYKDELAKKEKNVSKLQQQLDVARLDTSAAGQSRARALASQLEEARDDLEDYTLEHAIDVIVENLDKQYDEYEQLINRHLKELEDGVSGIESNTAPGSSLASGSEAGARAVLDLYTKSSISNNWLQKMVRNLIDEVKALLNNTRGATGILKRNKEIAMSPILVPLYHSGGLVGDLSTMESSEEFAKLMKGEFVSTPSQMREFMDRTLPAMLGASGNQFNAPLVQIQCGDITENTMPKVQKAVNEAVSEIKKMLNGGMSRTGYVGTIKKALI